MKRNKWFFLTWTVVVAALVLAGCMNSANQTKDDPQVSMQPSASAGMNNTGDVGSSDMAGVEGSGAATRFDWVNNAAQVETAINNLSEISQSRVVVTGTTALVAVKYDPQYKGETTERIREMVAGAVREADPTIQTVAVTSEEEDVNDVFEISDKIRGGQSADDLAEDINRIVRNATTLR